MDNLQALLKFNEQILFNLETDNDKLFKIILGLECILDFENFKDFDGVKFCKYIQISFDELDHYLNLLVEQNIILEMETDSFFSTLYKLNYEYKNI